MKNGRGDIAIKRLQHYLKIFMKRRTKDILKQEGALNPGGRLLAEGASSSTGFKVTERKIEKIFAEFSAEERHFYNRLKQRTDKSLEEMMDADKVNYASALVLLLRLRQACNHPKLVAGKLGKDGEALGAEGGNGSQSLRKAKATNEDIDEIADMFGGLGVGSKKCDVCGLELSQELSRSGAVRCEDCENDLKLVGKHKSRKDKGSKISQADRDKKDQKPPGRKPRNRAVILDSDDEDDGEWIGGGEDPGPIKLGKAGGTDDENAEGEGESIGSTDTDSESEEVADQGSKTDVKYLDSKVKSKKEVITIDGSTDGDDSESDVEDDFQSSSEDETKLATIVASTKITHLLKILRKEAAEHKFIVFSQFTSMLDLVEPFLKRDGYKYTRYDGSMRNDLREASLSRLRNDKSCRILLCSLKCGSLGLNLTAATRVVILEPFWNPFVEEQAIDRVHRLTQKINVIVYKITIQDTVEERILELQEKKRELANQAIEGGAKSNAGKLGMKEILQLFRRDAEHAPQHSSDYTMSVKPRILSRSSAPSSREGSVSISGERTATPLVSKPVVKENEIYGRRW
jgi:SNF2 family DNA or RNA helicase